MNVVAHAGQRSILGYFTFDRQQERGTQIFGARLQRIDFGQSEKNDFSRQMEPLRQKSSGLLKYFGRHRNVHRFRLIRTELVNFGRNKIAQLSFGFVNRSIHIAVRYANLVLMIRIAVRMFAVEHGAQATERVRKRADKEENEK